MRFPGRLFSRRETRAPQQLPRLRLDDPHLAIYAIGDVHGCLRQLLELEARIVADAEETGVRSPAIIVLGDFIDRGPDSAGVIDHLVGEPPARFVRYVLSGNHERMLLWFLAEPDANAKWLQLGGSETLRSYNVPIPLGRLSRSDIERIGLAARTIVPEAHRRFLEGLAGAIAWEGFAFVHAGFRAGLAFDKQSDEDLLGFRGAEPEPNDDVIVVHGHQVVRQPVASGRRIAVDLGCYATGRLAAARIEPGKPTRFLAV